MDDYIHSGETSLLQLGEKHSQWLRDLWISTMENDLDSNEKGTTIWHDTSKEKLWSGIPAFTRVTCEAMVVLVVTIKIISNQKAQNAWISLPYGKLKWEQFK